MTKKELLKAISANANITEQQASIALDVFIGSVTNSLNGNGKLSVPGLGTFKKVAKPERSGTSLGHEWTKPAHNAVTFKAAPALKDSVNQ